MVLIAFLDDTIDEASEIDTGATVDGPDSALPNSWAQLGLGSTIRAVGWGGVGNWGSVWVWNWRDDGVCVCVCFPPAFLEHFIPGLKIDVITTNIQVNDNNPLFK